MTNQPLPGTADFERSQLTSALLLSCASLILIALYLGVLLDVRPEEWSYFVVVVACLFPPLFLLVRLTTNRLQRPIVRALAAEEEAGASRGELVAAFRAVSRLPLYNFVSGVGWWALGGSIVAAGMKLRFAGMPAFTVATICFAAASGGFVTSVFHYFISRGACASLLEGLGRRIGDEAICREQITRVTLRRKLTLSVTGVSVVVVVFAMFLSMVYSGAPIERNATRIHARFLENEVGALPLGETIDGAALAARARRLGIADDVLLLDAKTGRPRSGARAQLSPEETALVLGEAEGRSTEINSASAFAWSRPAGRDVIVVARSDWSALHADSGSLGLVFGGLLATAALVSWLLSFFLSRDVSERTLALERVVKGLAEGDLRAEIQMQAEDELGDLSRAFEKMARTLRGTVGGLVDAANFVEGTAGEIAGIAEVVSRGANDQSAGVEQALRTMEDINGQVGGISTAAGELNTLVEESSSSILEMGAAGDELNDTAGALSARIEETSSSIDQMVQSVNDVGTHTGALSDAATETSSSMEEMASAMRHIDTVAEEAAKLSRHAVEAAEGGRDTVSQTISGMESIRDATGAAENVITVLGSKAREIGSILDVIDDVADETNLLALNAAIIAAQAGEHGRAFSVVADEIKELADRVLASTKEIGDLIGSLQTESENAVGAIAEGTRNVATGVERSQEAGAALEEITSASREGTQRLHEIVRAVQEQSKAATHVVEMMDRVNGGVDAIHRATAEQGRGNEVVHRSTLAMRDVSQQLSATTEEQARGSARIRESVEGVRDATVAINGALQTQSEACQDVVGFLEEVSAGGRANDVSSRRLAEATRTLLGQAETLRQGVRHFRLADQDGDEGRGEGDPANRV